MVFSLEFLDHVQKILDDEPGYNHGGYPEMNSGGGVVDLTGDEDLTDEDGDTRMGDSIGVLVSLGDEISSRGKKSRESNIGGSTIAGKIDSEDKRSLVKSSEESGEMFPIDSEIEDNVVEEEDGEWICFLGGNSSSGTKKYRGSNSNDGGNTGDGVKIAVEYIGSGDENSLRKLLSDGSMKNLVETRSISYKNIQGEKASSISEVESGIIIMEISIIMENSIIMGKQLNIIIWEITVVILVRDRCPRGKDNLPRLPIRTNIVRLATPSMGSYEHYKGVVAEVEHSKPGFELQGAKMVETGQNRDFRLRTARVTTPGLRFLRRKWGMKKNEDIRVLFIQKGGHVTKIASLIMVLGRVEQLGVTRRGYVQASTSDTQTDKAPVYDSDGSAEVHEYDNCYNNEIFNMFTQEEHVEQSGGTVEQHPATVEETRSYFESLYINLAIEVKKVNTVNQKMKETNADLTTELARYKNQLKCFEINQEKYDKLGRCYQKSVYQEKCLTKNINAFYLSSAKTMTTLNEEITNLNNQLSKEKSNDSCLQPEKKKLKSNFKTREDELLDKKIQLENKIKELDNILVKAGQSIQTMHMLSPKPDSFYHTEQKMALETAKFVRDFKSLVKEADESLAKHKALEYEIEHLLKAVVSEQKDTTQGTSANSKFIKQSILGKPTSSSKSKLYFVTPVLNSKVIPKVDNFEPNKHVKASVRTKPIIVSQLHVITKKDVNSNTNGLPSSGVESIAKTRRPHHRRNPKNDRIPTASSEGNNIKLAIWNEKSEVVCATFKQCLITANHDECVFKYVNGMNSRKKNQRANVSKSANQKKHKPNGKKSKKLGYDQRLASPRPCKPRTCLRWLPTGRISDLCIKIIVSSNTESESDTSVCDNASASNPQEPTSKGFPNSTSFLDRLTRLRRQTTCIHLLNIL
ncbi:hypothetical protein Tco_1114025 [Tanacetum coccineum]|uniref:Uncharacterized protein n=1 Tax=Tanacetum coccineum TaxID=301880 RepID=A0ABQ5ITV8_9ASTR